MKTQMLSLLQKMWVILWFTLLLELTEGWPYHHWHLAARFLPSLKQFEGLESLSHLSCSSFFAPSLSGRWFHVTEIVLTGLLTFSFPQTSTDSFTNSADPDETAHKSSLIWIYSVCHSVIDL